MNRFPFLRPAEGPDELGRLGGYRVLRLLGEGAMAYVFQAEDIQLHRRVALKILKPQDDNHQTEQRFFQEARVVASLSHEHIVSVFQFGTDNDVPFLAMEELAGETLQARLHREKWLPVAEALQIARQVAEGLQAAHEKGLVHRDIKPGNIWLESVPERNRPLGEGSSSLAMLGFRRVKILDFGLVKQLDGGNSSSLTVSGQVLGTPAYMAPEMMHRQPVDARTDLYSLGCVLYHMLTGHPPLDDTDHDTRAELVAVVVHDIKPLETLVRQMPRAVAAFMLQLMAKDPADRPQSATAAVARLRALQQGDQTLPDLSALLARSAPAQHKRKRVPTRVWIGAGIVLLALAFGAAVGLLKFFTTDDKPGPKTPTSKTTGPKP